MGIDIALGVVCPRPVALWVSKPISVWITDLRNFFCNQKLTERKAEEEK